MSTRSGCGSVVRIGWRSAALGSLVVAWAAGLGVFALYKSKVTAAAEAVAAEPAPLPAPVPALPSQPAPAVHEPPELTVVVPVPVVPPAPKSPVERPFWLKDVPTVAAGDNEACDTFGTAIGFERSPTAALARAGREDKLALVIHLAGNLEDEGFT